MQNHVQEITTGKIITYTSPAGACEHMSASKLRI